MVIFPRVSGWINQNIQQRLIKAESNRNENVNTHKEIDDDDDDTKEQLKLWRDAEKKEPWHDAAPKLKVEIEDGYTDMNVRFTMGLPPQAAYDLITNPNNQPYSGHMQIGGLLENKSRTFMEKYDDDETWKVEKDVPLLWNFLSVPITLNVLEMRPRLMGVFTTKKLMFTDSLSGNWSVEPTYVDLERLCKHCRPDTREEYMKCSGGQGKIASKVTIGFLFESSFPFNLPPFSWCVRGFMAKSAKTLVHDLQNLAAAVRGV